MSKRSRPPVPPTPPAPVSPHQDPDGGHGATHDLLTAAVAEAARLLDADGAMVYLLDPATGRLRFAHDAGIRSERGRAWVRRIELDPGTGMFGRAVAERAVVVTDDYLADSSFRHAPDPDGVVRDIGIRSMVVAPLRAGDEVFGALGTFAARERAFEPAQIALVRALADHAAAAIANTRLIDELGRSRAELAVRVEVERTLREITARISAATDLSSVLQSAVDEAARLLQADGARIDLIDPKSGLLRWAYASGALQPDDDIWPDDPDETLDQGVSGQAVIVGAPFWTGDYQHDERFPHGVGADTYIDASGISSVMAAPLIGTAGAFGTLTVFTSRRDAWADADATLLESIAAPAAIAISRARLIDELDRSRGKLARRAEAEQALREIAARITALRDPAEILQEVVELASRLVRGQGAILDLLDPASGDLRWAFDDGLANRFTPEERAQLWISIGVGATGVAVAEDRVVIAGDDLASLFPPSPESTEFYERTGFHSMIAAPITGDEGPLGVLEVYSLERDAFDASDGDLIRALAGQAAIAITNARLITELAGSRTELARIAETERTLREIAAQVSAMRNEDEILQAVVDAAQRLLRGTGSMIDLMDLHAMTGSWTYRQTDDSIVSNVRLLDEVDLVPHAGVSGTAIASRQVEWTGDYLADDRFEHTPERDAFVRDGGYHSVIAAPLLQRGEVLGAITVYADRMGAFDATDAAVLSGLADQAAIAIANVHLIDQLERSQTALARRAETERSLRDITARIGALHDPDEVLSRVVEDAKRLLETDGAHLTRMAESGEHLTPVMVAGAADDLERSWLMEMEFPLGGGINGLAAQLGEAVTTFDYLTDPRIPHEPDDQLLAERLGLRGMAATPLRAPGGEVIGTLAVSTATPRVFEADELDLLGGLADQAAIALTNSNLLSRVTREEARFRGLVQTTPDVIWRADHEGRFTFMADAGEALFGWPIEEIIGQQFGFLTDPGSMPLALEKYRAVGVTPDLVERVPLTLVRRDGSTFAAEVTTTGVFEDGRWVGAQGTVRDVSERSRLESELRQSEERYRFLVDNSPDIIFAIGPDGTFSYISESVRRALGRDPVELIGASFSEVIHHDEPAQRGRLFAAMRADPDLELVTRMQLLHVDGRRIPFEVSSVGVWVDGAFSGIHGAARDIGERERLERDLRDSEERYRFLVQNSPDAVFSTDADGLFVFLSAAIEPMTGYRTDELVGQHFSTIIDDVTLPVATGRWDALVADPADPAQAMVVLKGRDGRRTPVDIRAIGLTQDGRFAGIQGATRDISEQVRLQAELRRQAGELAAGEERAHLARELHDSVTQALFSMTMVTRSVELLLDRDVPAAREQLTQLRELQREALAEMRALIFELRPGNLEQDGLVRALKTHTSALQGRLGLPIVVESDLTGRLPLVVEEVLYRIAQEALHNVVKHAKAKQVWVGIHALEGGVRLRIQDDGQGFDPATVPDGHLGLAGMRARADRIGASFSVESQGGRGTTIAVVVTAAELAALREGAGGSLSMPDLAPSIRDG